MLRNLLRVRLGMKSGDVLEFSCWKFDYEVMSNGDIKKWKATYPADTFPRPNFVHPACIESITCVSITQVEMSEEEVNSSVLVITTPPEPNSGEKIKWIKVIREFCGLGLKDAKDLLEQKYPVTLPPVVSNNGTTDDFFERLRKEGADVCRKGELKKEEGA